MTCTGRFGQAASALALRTNGAVAIAANTARRESWRRETWPLDIVLPLIS